MIFQNFEEDVINSIEKFQKLEADLEAYPEWKDKIVDEIGGLFHVIHNNLTESEAKRKIFLKLVTAPLIIEPSRIFYLIVIVMSNCLFILKISSKKMRKMNQGRAKLYVSIMAPVNFFLVFAVF